MPRHRWPEPIDPEVFVPPPNPGFTGVYARNEGLREARRLPDIGPGPEDVTKGPDGWFYTGLQDGRIVRFREDGSAAEDFVNTHGRPLGMQFDRQGRLIVADAFRGLLSVAADRRISVLVDSVGGERLLFPNDLDIAADGTIWFSDSSRRFDQRRWILDFLETRGTGRLLAYNPRNGETAVRLDGLMFANGVAVGPEDAYVLVNETIGARITRLWLRGANAGHRDTFLTLPGYPDNLSFNDNGLFWVALASPRKRVLEWLWRGAWLRKLLALLPAGAIESAQGRAFSWVIAVDTGGNVVRNLQDSHGGSGEVASVNEFDGRLYLGSIGMSSVGRYGLRSA